MANNDDKTGPNQQINPNDPNGQEEQESSLMKKIKDLKKKDRDDVHQKCQEELEELKKAKADAEDRAVRAMAELQNAQKRMEGEKSSFAAFATQSLVLQVLEIYENYHRLLEHEPEFLSEETRKRGSEAPLTQWKVGFELIEKQFQSFMQQQGVAKIELKAGDKIDPIKHQAMLTGEGEEGVVLEVFSPGYEMRGRVVKTAKVKVGAGKKET